VGAGVPPAPTEPGSRRDAGTTEPGTHGAGTPRDPTNPLVQRPPIAFTIVISTPSIDSFVKFAVFR